MARNQRSNFTFSNRVTAAVASARIAEILQDASIKARSNDIPTSLPWEIVAMLKRSVVVDRSRIRACLDGVLNVNLSDKHKVGWLRLHVAEAELACGIRCDARSLAAHKAWNAEHHSTWTDYVRGLKAPAAEPVEA